MNFQELIDQLLANSWRAGILIAALFAFRGVLRRFLDARVIYWFWVLVALRLLLPFDVPVSVSAARYLPPAPWTSAMDFDTVPSVSASAPVAPNSIAPPAAASLREILLNEKTLAMVWLAGVAAVLLAYFRASLSFRRQLSRSGRRAGKRMEQAVSSCSRAMGLNPIPVLEMEALSGPALFGVWRPRLLFPVGLADQLSDEELRLVVLHELGHLKRRDLFLQGLLVVSQAVHWFNPLVWLAGRLAREDRELACDEFVMAHTSHSGGHAYAKTLLRVLGLSRPGRPMLPAVGILETKNQIKQRIIMITKYQSTNARRLMLGAASILAVSAGLLMVSAADNGFNDSTDAFATPERINELQKVANRTNELQKVVGGPFVDLSETSRAKALQYGIGLCDAFAVIGTSGISDLGVFEALSPYILPFQRGTPSEQKVFEAGQTVFEVIKYAGVNCRPNGEWNNIRYNQLLRLPEGFRNDNDNYPRTIAMGLGHVFVDFMELLDPVTPRHVTPEYLKGIVAALARLDAADKTDVQEPHSTPHDLDPRLKTKYLECYDKGYRTVLASVSTSYGILFSGPDNKASQDGWYDGIKTAKKNHPEKVAEMFGVPLGVYSSWLAEEKKK